MRDLMLKDFIIVLGPGIVMVLGCYAAAAVMLLARWYKRR